ncbi:MAG: DUF2867 domain-containing protein [bacterium]|nr:DUF2867 domain-containing protein [bacterium]
MDGYIAGIKELKPLLDTADHTDVKVAEGHAGMREFIAALLSYYPWWIAFLFRIRSVLVRILGLVKHSIPGKFTALRPEDVPLTPGETAAFFIVRFAEENAYWVAETPPDKHLGAYIAVVVEPLNENINRFHVITIVHYKHWTGPVYFNLIRPFHHLVVRRMMKAALKDRKKET